MSFVVIETYTYKKGKLEKLEKALLSFLPFFKTIETLSKVELLRDEQNTKLLGITTWVSKEAFDTFLNSPAMLKMLESEEMREIQEATERMNVQMYEKVELDHDQN